MAQWKELKRWYDMWGKEGRTPALGFEKSDSCLLIRIYRNKTAIDIQAYTQHTCIGFIYIYLNVYTLHISFLPFLIHYMHILYVCRNLHKTTISRVFGAKGIDHCCLGFCVHVCKRVCVCFRLIRGFVEGPLFLKQYFPLFPFFPE